MKHLVRMDNESINDIAARCDLSVSEILRINNISIDSVKPGKILIVEKRYGTRYVVRPHDTLANIAAAHGVSVDKIKTHNRINDIFLGEVIYLPTAE